MALVSRPRKKRLSWLVGYTILCAVFGVWGAYDYWVRIPKQLEDFAKFNSVKSTVDRLEAKAQSTPGSLTDAEAEEYERAQAEFRKYTAGAPTEVPAYDAPLQLWVYVVGCGVLGTPWFFWLFLKLKGRSAELDDSGNLTVDGKSLEASRIQSVDMSRWMSKSVATVVGTDGQRIEIDDYFLQDAHLIVGRLAHRFEPDIWNEDATKRKPPESDEPDEPSSGQQTTGTTGAAT